ncbi:MAG TPA: hypothetical protein PK360_04935, partial [bacterium]|nr:hypothetical protein [bacterium]
MIPSILAFPMALILQIWMIRRTLILLLYSFYRRDATDETDTPHDAGIDSGLAVSLAGAGDG